MARAAEDSPVLGHDLCDALLARFAHDHRHRFPAHGIRSNKPQEWRPLNQLGFAKKLSTAPNAESIYSKADLRLSELTWLQGSPDRDEVIRTPDNPSVSRWGSVTITNSR